MQENSFLLTNRHLQDLNPVIAGTHDCDPGHGPKPAIRKYTLIHYVFRGKGTLFNPEGALPVQAGQAFLIRQGELANYQADLDDPWYYCWIGFDGTLAAKFDTLPSILTPPENIFLQIIKAAQTPVDAEYRMAAELFHLYAELFSDSSRKNPHVQQVENYLRLSYTQPLRIGRIAQQLNLDRRYLARLFKAQTGVSMQQYLLHIRMEAADLHLSRGHSVRESARLSGYEDTSNFTKLYQRHFGRSPAIRRKEHHQ